LLNEPLVPRIAMEGWKLGPLMVISTDASPIVLDRSKRLAAQSESDNYAFLYCQEGGLKTIIGDSQTSAQEGEVAVRDMGLTYQSIATRGQKSLVYIPRDALDPLLPSKARGHIHGLHLRRGSVMTRLLTDHLQRLLQLLPTTEQMEVPFVAHSLMNLIAGSVAFSTESAENLANRFPVETLTQIKTFIRHNLNNPDLGPEFLSRHFRLSRASIYKLFAPLSGVASYIQTQRLQGCLRDLSDTRLSDKRINEIAYNYGFIDQSHFSHLFRRAFGVSPSEARHLAVVGRKADITGNVLNDDHPAIQFRTMVETLGRR